MKKILWLLAIPTLILCYPRASTAQEVKPETVNIFLDCSNCDDEYLRQNITFINYVHDRKDADVHILITVEDSGAGKSYKIQYIGLNRYAGKDYILDFGSSSTDTIDESRQRLARNFTFGLLPYVTDKEIADHIKVVYTEQQNTPNGKTQDPWNYWVFRISTNSSTRGEEKNKTIYGNASVSANRTTENWKFNLDLDGSYDKDKYVLSDGSVIQNTRKNYSSSSYLVKSIGRDWALGGSMVFRADKYFNLKPSHKISLALEHNFFPYKESSQHMWTLIYQVGLSNLNYLEKTVFDKKREILLSQRVGMNFTAIRPWGNADLGTDFSYIGKLSRNGARVGGDLSWRLVRGLSINFSGQISSIRDQVYLSAKNASPEEILLQQKALATNFSYYARIGFTFRFGSIFNNIVNSRSAGLTHDVF